MQTKRNRDGDLIPEKVGFRPKTIRWKKYSLLEHSRVQFIGKKMNNLYLLSSKIALAFKMQKKKVIR